MVLLNYSVGSCVGEDDGRLEVFSLVDRHDCVCHDYDNVAGLHLACRGAVQTYYSGASFAFYRVGVKPFSVVIVDDIYAFAFKYIRSLHQLFIYRDAAYIVKACFGYRHAMYL